MLSPLRGYPGPNDSHFQVRTMTLSKKTLGRTGLEVTQLGYGSMGLRGPKTWGVRVVSDEAADVFLNAVLDAGVNFVDTSPDYGISEKRIGEFISSRRDEYYLATNAAASTHSTKITWKSTTSGKRTSSTETSRPV